MKNKFFIALSFLSMFILLFSGCGLQLELADDVTAETKTEKSTEIDYSEILNEKVNEYYAYIRNFNDNSESEAGYTGVNEIINSVGQNKALSLIGYIIKDINKDYIPELIIGSVKDKQIYAVYGFEGENAVLIEEGYGRNRFYYLDSSVFYNEDSGGASNTVIGLYSLKEKASHFSVEKIMFTALDENNNCIYYSTDKNDLSLDNANVSSEYEFNQFIAEYKYKKIQLELTPFSSMNKDDTGKNIIENAIIKGEIADEDVIKSNCEYYVADESEYGVYVKLNTDVTVNSFKFLGVSIVSNDSDIEYKTNVLHSFGNVDADTPVVIKMTFYGDIPTYAFSYEDSDGSEKRFLLELSGDDGSLIMNEF